MPSILCWGIFVTKEGRWGVSDCGVCVSFCDYNECIGYRCVIVKAGQEWQCCECGKMIRKGDKYELAS